MICKILIHYEKECVSFEDVYPETEGLSTNPCGRETGRKKKSKKKAVFPNEVNDRELTAGRCR